MTRDLLLRAIAAATIVLSPAVPSAARQAVPPPPPQAPPVPQVGIAVFEDVNYGGRRLTFVADQRNLRNTVLDNRISSLVIAAGEILGSAATAAISPATVRPSRMPNPICSGSDGTTGSRRCGGCAGRRRLGSSISNCSPARTTPDSASC